MKNAGILRLFLVGILLLGQAPTASGQAAPAVVQSGSPVTVRPPKLAIEGHQHSNGLRVLLVEDHSVPVVNLQMWYHVGSKDERAGRTGFAHLFEHLMYKGSAHVGPEEHSRIIEAVGGFDNAYTAEDVTVFWETFPSNYLERVIWLEADRMGSLNVDEKNFTSEREVVKEERRLRVENRPYGLVFEDLYGAAYTVHPYKHPVLGSMEDLNQAKLTDVQEFFKTYYRPNNATTVIVGDFEPSEAIRWVEKYFSGVPPSPQPIPRVTLREPPQQQERRIAKSYSNSPLPAVVVGYKMPPLFSPDSYPLILASNILSQGESSRLYRQLVYVDRIAEEVSGSGNFTEDPNLFLALTVMQQGKSETEGEMALDAVLGKMKNEPVEPSELQKAKNQEIARFILGRRTVQEKADAIGLAAVLGKDPNLVNTELDRYLQVTAADIQRVARQYFLDKQRTVLVVEAPKPSKRDGREP